MCCHNYTILKTHMYVWSQEHNIQHTHISENLQQAE